MQSAGVHHSPRMVSVRSSRYRGPTTGRSTREPAQAEKSADELKWAEPGSGPCGEERTGPAGRAGRSARISPDADGALGSASRMSIPGSPNAYPGCTGRQDARMPPRCRPPVGMRSPRPRPPFRARTRRHRRRAARDRGFAGCARPLGLLGASDRVIASSLAWPGCLSTDSPRTALAPHHAGLRPAWSSSGGRAHCNAAPVADHGNGRDQEQQGVAVPGEGRHARSSGSARDTTPCGRRPRGASGAAKRCSTVTHSLKRQVPSSSDEPVASGLVAVRRCR